MSGYNDIIDGIIDELKKDKPDFAWIRDHLDSLRPKEYFVQAASIFGHRTRQPFVELRIHGLAQRGPQEDAFIITQWSPTEARHHAMVVLEAAEAAEQDAFIVAYFTERVGSSLEAIGAVLQEYRAFRSAQREKGQ